MRIVIDTNVVIAGLYSRRGASFQILKAALRGVIDYAVSPLIALEYIGKVEDKIADGLLNQPREVYFPILKVLINNGLQIRQPVPHRPVLNDVTDDKILECAVTAKCDAIVTFNVRDFPGSVINRYNIRVVLPGTFVKEVMKR